MSYLLAGTFVVRLEHVNKFRDDYVSQYQLLSVLGACRRGRSAAGARPHAGTNSASDSTPRPSNGSESFGFASPSC